MLFRLRAASACVSALFFKLDILYAWFFGNYNKYPLIIPHTNDTIKVNHIVSRCGWQKVVVNTNMEFR